MSVGSGHAKLKRAARDLLVRWRSVQAMWRDENSRKFEENYIDPFMAKLRITESAMGHMTMMLDQIRRDCG